jgi:hypothetical protein
MINIHPNGKSFRLPAAIYGASQLRHDFRMAESRRMADAFAHALRMDKVELRLRLVITQLLPHCKP